MHIPRLLWNMEAIFAQAAVNSMTVSAMFCKQLKHTAAQNINMSYVPQKPHPTLFYPFYLEPWCTGVHASRKEPCIANIILFKKMQNIKMRGFIMAFTISAISRPLSWAVQTNHQPLDEEGLCPPPPELPRCPSLLYQSQQQSPSWKKTLYKTMN